MLVFLLLSDLRCHKQWPLFEHSHCAGNENLLLSASLFSWQGYSTQAGVKSKLQTKQPALAFLFPCGLRHCVFWGGIWLNNKPPGGKSWGIAMAGIWLNPKPERWIIHPFSQWFGTAPETRASRSQAEAKGQNNESRCETSVWSVSKPNKATSLKLRW